MISKGELGFAYLFAVGLGIFGSFASGVLNPIEVAEPLLTAHTGFAIVSGCIVAGGFIMTAVGLARSDFSDDRIWRVARWSAIGLGIPTGLTIMMLITRPSALTGLDWRSVAILNIAGGGVVGILTGTIVELREEHTRTTALNERNMVFLRLFRHDIRNSAHVILGQTDYIEEEASAPTWSLDAVRNQIDQILHLSDAARQLDELDHEKALEPIDIVSVVHDQLEGLSNTHPMVSINTTLPEEAYVLADDLLASVVNNLLTNAVEHNDDDPSLEVTVRDCETKPYISLQIRDNGPGFSEDELAVHSQSKETSLRHSGGIGLWISRWIVESYEGKVTVGNSSNGGAVVRVRLPKADGVSNTSTSDGNSVGSSLSDLLTGL